MRIKNLPERKKKELDSAFKKSKSAKEQNRIQVLRLLSKGYKRKEVVKITNLSKKSISLLVTAYNRKGIKGLLLKPSPRNHSKLTIKQKDKIKEILKTCKTPSEAELKVNEDFDFWSTATLKLLVKKMFKVEYNCLESYQLLFKYCGFSYQRAEFQDTRRNSQQTDDFKQRLKVKLKKGAMSMWW